MDQTGMMTDVEPEGGLHVCMCLCVIECVHIGAVVLLGATQGVWHCEGFYGNMTKHHSMAMGTQSLYNLTVPVLTGGYR